MNKRVISRTKTTDLHTDGTTSTSETERMEESASSGLLEAWGFFLLLLFTLLLAFFTYKVVSGIVQREQSNAIQEQQNQQFNY